MLEWVHISAGMSFFPFEQPEIGWDFITGSQWCLNICCTFAKFRLTLKINDIWLPKSMLVINQYLIDVVLSQIPTAYMKQRFNMCRLYLKVTTILDLLTLDGTKVEIGLWHGDLPLTSDLL